MLGLKLEWLSRYRGYARAWVILGTNAYNGNCGVAPVNTRPGCEALHLHLSNACFKNEWSHTSASLVCLNGVDRDSFTLYIYFTIRVLRGRSSVACIATRYGLEGPGIKFRWGTRLSAPVQTGPGAHPASYTMDTGSLSWG
jgi:hypothetical protein